MAAMYCALCQRPVEPRRHVGAGTVFFAVITAGLSLLAIPFYQKRCPICKSAALSPAPPGTTLRSGAEVASLEKRLAEAQEALEAADTELDRVRTERDFYRQLRGPANPGAKPPTQGRDG